MGKTTGYLLDNLWIWAAIALGIMAVYGVWSLIETIQMHGVPGIKPVSP